MNLAVLPHYFRAPRIGKNLPVEMPASDRSTSPDARMNLLLRFETESGPRTVVAPNLPLKLASEITTAMIRSGHYAEFIDQYTPLSIAERVKLQKRRTATRKNAQEIGNDNVFAIAPSQKKAS